MQLISGKDANDYMAPDYAVNVAQPPSPGMELMLIQIEITLISGGELQLHGVYFRIISDGQVSEQAYIAQYDGQYPALNTDLLLPGHGTSRLYTTVNIADPSPLIGFGMNYGGSADTSAFFALTSKLHETGPGGFSFI